MNYQKYTKAITQFINRTVWKEYNKKLLITVVGFIATILYIRYSNIQYKLLFYLTAIFLVSGQVHSMIERIESIKKEIPKVYKTFGIKPRQICGESFVILDKEFVSKYASELKPIDGFYGLEDIFENNQQLCGLEKKLPNEKTELLLVDISTPFGGTGSRFDFLYELRAEVEEKNADRAGKLIKDKLEERSE